MNRILAILASCLVVGCNSQPNVIEGSDRQVYVRVRKADNQVGAVVDTELWQRAGETGKDKPFYTRRLQAPSDTTPPIFSKVR